MQKQVSISALKNGFVVRNAEGDEFIAADIQIVTNLLVKHIGLELPPVALVDKAELEAAIKAKGEAEEKVQELEAKVKELEVKAAVKE